jgi:hypothetical protein
MIMILIIIIIIKKIIKNVQKECREKDYRSYNCIAKHSYRFPHKDLDRPVLG